MASSRPDLEALLQDGNIIRIRPQGYSMYPLFIPGRDEALIESVSADTVRKNDVVLYRRDQSILVLHRICKITAEGFFMVGDNQSEIEGPLRADQIKGRLIAFVRNGNFGKESAVPLSLCSVAFYAAAASCLLSHHCFFARI